MDNKDLFYKCVIRPVVLLAVDAVINRMIANKDRYIPVVKATGVPWWWIGIIHYQEVGFRFDVHLYNGDPLTARTSHVPKGHPLRGKPPFEWEDSAIDALQSQGLGKPDVIAGETAKYSKWSLDFALERMERYNGLGYRKKGVVSPYLWAGSTHYLTGKFTADGKYDPNAVSKQIGGAVILSRLLARKLVELQNI